MDYLVNFCRVLVVANTVADTAICPVDNNIGLMFSSDGLGFVNGGGLFPVFRGDAFVPLTAYRPILLIGHHVLVPGSGPVLCSGALKKTSTNSIKIVIKNLEVFLAIKLVLPGHQDTFLYLQNSEQ